MGRKAVILGWARTAFQPASKGAFAKARPDDLLAHVLEAALSRSGVDAGALEDVIVGCAFPEAEQGLNVARLASLIADLPEGVAGCTVNRFCGSSMQAAHMAAGAIALDAGDAFLIGGVESMTRVPIPGFNPSPNPALAARMPAAYVSMGETAENVARRFEVSRARMDAFALASQQKAARAAEAGAFDAEISAFEGVDRDGCIRPDSTEEGLASLAPAFAADGSVTAGTSSPLTDGACALVIASDEFARAHGLEPLAAIRAVAVAGCAPEIMGIGPAPASEKALRRAGLQAGDLDVVELNEAFASQALVCIEQLGLDPARVNLDGGAIALGHPLGATGARLLGKAVSLLQRERKNLALATQCIGGGQGIATVLEAA